MLSVDEALARCLALEVDSESEHRPLAQCAGARLAAPLNAQAPLPRWDNSAMDGYAMRGSDARRGAVLKVVEVIPAGVWPERALKPGEAARIFTGAPLPTGADVVVIQEHCTALEGVGLGSVRVERDISQGQNIRRRGEEVKEGSLIAARGEVITPGLLGLCAAQGYAQLNVHREPRVALLETGTELISPGKPLTGAQIYATHHVTLAPMIQSSGGALVHCARVGDSVDEVVELLRDLANREIDLIITTGGVSVGEFDPLHEALTQLGAERHFWKVKMKPGKPVSVTSLSRTASHAPLPIFSLPGNPVSCVVGYLLFVHPLIQRASGVPSERLGMSRITCRLTSPIEKRHTRAELLRVSVSLESASHDLKSCREHPRGSQGATPDPQRSFWSCALTGGQSSAWISSVAFGDGLLWVPADPVTWPIGHEVEVSLFPWTRLLPTSLYLNDPAQSDSSG